MSGKTARRNRKSNSTIKVGGKYSRAREQAGIDAMLQAAHRLNLSVFEIYRAADAIRASAASMLPLRGKEIEIAALDEYLELLGGVDGVADEGDDHNDGDAGDDGHEPEREHGDHGREQVVEADADVAELAVVGEDDHDDGGQHARDGRDLAGVVLEQGEPVDH